MYDLYAHDKKRKAVECMYPKFRKRKPLRPSPSSSSSAQHLVPMECKFAIINRGRQCSGMEPKPFKNVTAEYAPLASPTHVLSKVTWSLGSCLDDESDPVMQGSPRATSDKLTREIEITWVVYATITSL